MASMAFYLAASVLLAQSTVAFNCSRAPIYVDIHKRAVHDSPKFQYGSFIGVGSPAQNHSLWPSLSQNHTSFAAPTFCGNGTLRECDTSTGGFFSSKDSTTFQDTKDFKSLDNGNNATLDGYFGQDTLRLYTHYFETDGASQTLLENSTIEVAEEGSSVPGVVGMGLSSTVLRDLAARDMIAGKTYSLYIGQGFDRAGGAVNGSNVFGGYDSGRFSGPVHKYPMNTARDNPMTVKIKDIVLTATQDSTTSNISLFDTQAFPNMKTRPDTFEAEITTSQFPLSLPYSLTQNFISHLGASKDNFWGDNSLKLSAPFEGTLSIVLEDGFTVTFPSEVLANASNITPIQDRDEDSDAPFYLGAAFLGQVYLMADFEAQSFFLADAVQKNNAVMPVPFCPRGPDPVAYERPQQGAWAKQGLVGAVIGGVLGGIGIAICAYCFVLSCQRRRAERKVEKAMVAERRAKYAQMEIEEVPEFDPPPKSATPFFWKKR